MKFTKRILSALIVFALISAFSVMAYAHDIVPFTADGKILSVSHGGDTMQYPKNSLEAIKAAFETGADFVSVDIRRTEDGKFALSDSDDLGAVSLEGKGMHISMLPLAQITLLHLTDKTANLSECLITDLSAALKVAVAYDKSLIIDGEWENREQIYSCICDNNAEKNAALRTDASKKEISQFISATEAKCRIVGEYHGNVIFNARKKISGLSSVNCPVIYLGTKNSFGVIFRSGVISAFSKNAHSSRAAMKTYDINESGGRPDCEDTWDDIIDRGYSVIETDRIADLVSYIKRIEDKRKTLSSALSQADSTQLGYLTLQSQKDIKESRESAVSALTSISSFKRLSLAESNLNMALNNKVLIDSAGKAEKGTLNVTPGRIIAVLLVTAAFLFVQIYFYYMRADKKLPAWLKATSARKQEKRK